MSATPRSCVLSTSTRLKNDSTVFTKEFFSLRSDERMKLAATCELLKRLSRSCSMEYLDRPAESGGSVARAEKIQHVLGNGDRLNQVGVVDDELWETDEQADHKELVEGVGNESIHQTRQLLATVLLLRVAQKNEHEASDLLTHYACDHSVRLPNTHTRSSLLFVSSTKET